MNPYAELMEAIDATARREAMHATWGRMLVELLVRADGRIRFTTEELERAGSGTWHLHAYTADGVCTLDLVADADCDEPPGAEIGEIL